MKHVPIPTSVSPATLGGIRLARVLCAAAAALAVVAAPAMAQRQDRGADPRMQDMRGQQEQPRPMPQAEHGQRFDPRTFDSREFDERRMQQEAAARSQEARRSGRLTPDERRDLRRQINEAGMDLYSRPQHR